MLHVGLVGTRGVNLARGVRSGGAPALSGSLRASLEREGCAADNRSDAGRTHVPQAGYTVDPPAGGDHDPVPAPAGFYDTGDVPTDGHLVHSLEHGYVDIWYGNGLSTDQVNSLKSFADQDKVLVISYPNLPAGKSVAMTTWGRLQSCDKVDTDEIQAYIDQYKLKTAPEPSAA